MRIKDKSQLTAFPPLSGSQVWLIYLLLPIRTLAIFAPVGQSNLPLFTNNPYHSPPMLGSVCVLETNMFVVILHRSDCEGSVCMLLRNWFVLLLAFNLHQQQHLTKCTFSLCSQYFFFYINLSSECGKIIPLTISAAKRRNSVKF